MTPISYSSHNHNKKNEIEKYNPIHLAAGL